MIFAVEINVVQNKNNDFDNKTFKDEGWNLYAFSTSRLEKGPFSREKSWKKGFFYQKGAGILYLSPLDTLSYETNRERVPHGVKITFFFYKNLLI